MLEDILRKSRSIYYAMPSWQKAIVGNLYHMIPQRLRLGGNYAKFKKLLETSEYWSKQQWEDFQYREVLNTITQAYEHVPYYRKSFSECGLTPADFTCLDDIKKFPTLSKKDIQENREDLIADNVPLWRHLITTTGGSTAEPLSLLHEKGITRSKERAFIWNGWSRIGYYPRARAVQFKGRSVGNPKKNIFWEYEPIQGFLEMDSNYLTESRIPIYLKAIREFKPTFLIGYISSIYQLAQFLKNNPRFEFPQIEAICLASENVYQWQREFLADVFGCRIFSHYGHSEMVLLGMECEESHDLHFFPQYGYMEVLDSTGNDLSEPGETGELVGTSFHNNVMPLIRYRTQDYGIVGASECKCGRHYPIIRDVEGRLQEFIITADNRMISICVMGAAHFDISQFVYETQYYQDRPGHLVFRVSPRGEFGEKQKAIILSTLKSKLGDDVTVEIEQVEQIVKSRSGKHIMIEQKLSVPTYMDRSQSQKRNSNTRPKLYDKIMKKLPLTVIMLTVNEAFNLPGAIENVQDWAEEIFIVDSCSTDQTVDIALENGIGIVQRPFTNFGDQWNFALEKLPIQTPWTFKLDPDERLTPELKDEIRDLIKSEPACCGYEMNRRLWFMGKPLHVLAPVLRLWKTGKCKFSDVLVNEHPLIDGPVGKLENIFEHFDSPDLHHWCEKQNRYSTMEAIMRVRGDAMAVTPKLFGTLLERRMYLKKIFFRIPFRYQLQWLHELIIRGAWRDGFWGLAWIRLRVEVWRMRELKAIEIKTTGRIPEVPKAPCGDYDPRVLASPLHKSVCGDKP